MDLSATLFLFLAALAAAGLEAAVAGARPKPGSNITVMGTVFCDICANNSFSKHSYFLRGAKVRVECSFKAAGAAREEITISVERTTDRFGVYRVDVPPVDDFQCREGREIESFCRANLVRSSSPLCNVPGLSISSEHVGVRCAEANFCVYNLNALFYRPAKRDFALCGAAPAAGTGEQLSDSFGSSLFFWPPFPPFGFPWPFPHWPPFPFPFPFPTPTPRPLSPSLPLPQPTAVLSFPFPLPQPTAVLSLSPAQRRRFHSPGWHRRHRLSPSPSSHHRARRPSTSRSLLVGFPRRRHPRLSPSPSLHLCSRLRLLRRPFSSRSPIPVYPISSSPSPPPPAFSFSLPPFPTNPFAPAPPPPPSSPLPSSPPPFSLTNPWSWFHFPIRRPQTCHASTLDLRSPPSPSVFVSVFSLLRKRYIYIYIVTRGCPDEDVI
ncbi:unnamed protein product [Spirodela intermedia]|uniref:Uncharacterized protein n=1 Tax=Spirodela intermedia TaxID=51605 RepID=A0A7I8IS63_SPIIN|nr:unnamed protein product [Spirodela intermedia]CAA6659994.1 unnamed protein product [Spirodela intermedia]